MKNELILYPVAASLLLVTFCIGYFVSQKGSARNVLQALTLEEQKTPKGKQQHIVLEDGTMSGSMRIVSLSTQRNNFRNCCRKQQV